MQLDKSVYSMPALSYKEREVQTIIVIIIHKFCAVCLVRVTSSPPQAPSNSSKEKTVQVSKYMTDTVYLRYSELIYRRFIAHTLRVIQHYLSTICTQVTAHTPSQTVPYTKVLDVALNKIGRTVAGGNPFSIARAVYEHESIRELLHKSL